MNSLPNTSLKVQIRTLNDQFRRNFDPKLGNVTITSGVQALAHNELQQLLQAVKEFDNFHQDIDPWQEHDMGRIEMFSKTFYFKIDYLNRQRCQPGFGSDDPASVEKTLRVMTIMLIEEY